MVNVVQGQVQRVVMVFNPATVFGATVGEYPQYRQLVLLEEWQDFVVEHIGRGNRRFARIQLGKGHLGIGIDKGLLIDPANGCGAPRCSCTRRTARSRTSGENLFDLFMAPFSQRLEPPQNPGRFKKTCRRVFCRG